MNKGDQRSNPHSRVDSQRSITGATIPMDMGIESTSTLPTMEISSPPSRSHVERERNRLSASQLPPFSHDGGDSGHHSISSSDCELEHSTLEEVEEEVRKEVVQQRQLPFLDYLCHRCGRKGHRIEFCEVTLPETMTPYQGKRVSEGWFLCKRCDNNWHSLTSYANVAQTCHKCRKMVYPHKQKPIKKEDAGVDPCIFFFDLTHIKKTSLTLGYRWDPSYTVSNWNARSMHHQQMDFHERFNLYS